MGLIFKDTSQGTAVATTSRAQGSLLALHVVLGLDPTPGLKPTLGAGTGAQIHLCSVHLVVPEVLSRRSHSAESGAELWC